MEGSKGVNIRCFILRFELDKNNRSLLLSFFLSYYISYHFLSVCAWLFCGDTFFVFKKNSFELIGLFRPTSLQAVVIRQKGREITGTKAQGTPWAAENEVIRTCFDCIRDCSGKPAGTRTCNVKPGPKAMPENKKT